MQPEVPHEVLCHFSLILVKHLGGRINQHWLVETGGSQLVLREYAPGQIDNVAYEHEVIERLHRSGWPVPRLVESPIFVDGRIWALSTYLLGNSIKNESPADRRTRGRLLAELHQTTSAFTDMGQREGYQRADDVVRDPRLMHALREYESIRPQVGRFLRWHLDRTIELFEQYPIDEQDMIVLHSDFTAWNLLFDHDKLTGIIDFESTHLNLRVSDFALSWRGCYMEVIEGYEEVRRLSDRERQLIVPAYWSWLFIGMDQVIRNMLSGLQPLDDFEWTIKQLSRRSPIHSVADFPG